MTGDNRGPIQSGFSVGYDLANTDDTKLPMLAHDDDSDKEGDFGDYDLDKSLKKNKKKDKKDKDKKKDKKDADD